jgi:hypothetical protein
VRIDLGLLAAVKLSPAYRRLREEVDRPCPTDAWQDDEFAYVVFDLAQLASATPLRTPRKAVFVVHAGSRSLVAARIIATDEGAQMPAIDLLSEGPLKWNEFSLP